MKNWKQCIKKLDGRKVVIRPRPKNPETGETYGINTGGREGTIARFDPKPQKYEINFHNGFSGWYCFSEFDLV